MASLVEVVSENNELRKKISDYETFLNWIVSLDDPTGQGARERRTVTLNKIIQRARVTLNTREEV